VTNQGSARYHKLTDNVAHYHRLSDQSRLSSLS